MPAEVDLLHMRIERHVMGALTFLCFFFISFLWKLIVACILFDIKDIENIFHVFSDINVREDNDSNV